jgi:sulfate transport system permease protein
MPSFTRNLKNPSIIPGFHLTFFFTLFYLSLIVIIPILALIYRGFEVPLEEFWKNISSSRILYSFWITFLCSFIAVVIDVFFGLIIAWVLVRYSFPFKKLLDAIIDLPFALPTAVAGIALSAIYAPDGAIGRFFAEYGIKIAYTPLGIIVALVFIGLPFIVRSLQPVLSDLDKEFEEASISLGASRWQTFVKVIFPYLFPALLTGFTMAFARCLGEYGSIIFIAGNVPFVSEIVPLIIITKLEQFDYNGATVVALMMLTVSFCLLFLINSMQKKLYKKFKD